MVERRGAQRLKALSARVVRAAPNDTVANTMRAAVLSGTCAAWEVGPRSAAEIKKAATHLERAAALSHAPASKVALAHLLKSARNVPQRTDRAEPHLRPVRELSLPCLSLGVLISIFSAPLLTEVRLFYPLLPATGNRLSTSGEVCLLALHVLAPCARRSRDR